MGVVGCYSIDVYCDHPDHPLYPGPAVYTGETEGECLRQMRQDGWKIDKKGEGKNGQYRTLCRKHAGKATRPEGSNP